MKWKKFLKGFLWKIEAGEKNLKGFPFKFTPWLVLHVLHFIGDFFYTPALVLHVLHLKGIFLIIKGNFLQNFLWSPLSTSYSRACDESESEVKVKVKWSESIFGPLFFFNFRYIKVGVWGNNNIGIKKCRTTFLWVLNFGQVGEILENFQKHPLGESFWKMVSKVIFGKILQEISL